MTTAVRWAPQHREDCPDPDTCRCPQVEFHRRPEYEVLYGGSSGGGKTDSLLMEGTRQIDRPGYRAVFFRRTTPNLQHAILRSMELFPQLRGVWRDRDNTWRFPRGAIFAFRHMEHEEDWQLYQGHEYHYMAFDELTQFGEHQYTMTKAWCRTGKPDIRCYVRAASNPRGVGHAWVKARFVDHGHLRTVVETVTDPVTDQKLALTRCFVRARIHDNPIYVRNNPQALAHLLTLPDDQRRAYFEGDWDLVEGMYFTEWRNDIHVVPPFDLPKQWRRYGGLDYGYAKPFSFHLAAQDPDGTLYAYRERYGARVLDEDQAAQVGEACRGEGHVRIHADPSMWTKRGTGESPAEVYMRVFRTMSVDVALVPGDRHRIPGWSRVRQWLHPYEDERTGRMTAHLLVFEGACPNLVQTLPAMVHDETKPEDLDTDGKDHAVDGLRYLIMGRPKPARIDLQPFPDTLGALIKQMRDRKRAARYIGEGRIKPWRAYA